MTAEPARVEEQIKRTNTSGIGSDEDTDIDSFSTSGRSSTCFSSTHNYPQFLVDDTPMFELLDRKLPSLNRGWQTPDPSPTSAATNLPACSLMRLRTEVLESKLSLAYSLSSTPSQTPSRSGCASVARTRTPSPERDSCFSSMMPSPALSWYSDPFGAPHFVGNDEYTTGTWVMMGHQDTAVFTLTGFEDSQGSQQVDTAECQECLPSMGSIGHPYMCAGPCKYASKPRGCKDGDSCTRCHLCDWKTRKRATACHSNPAI